MLRIVVCGFGPVARRGIGSILLDADGLTAYCMPEVLMVTLGAFRPHVLLADDDGARAAAIAAARRLPHILVVLCSVSCGWMSVRRGPVPQFRRLGTAELLDSVRGAR